MKSNGYTIKGLKLQIEAYREIAGEEGDSPQQWALEAAVSMAAHYDDALNELLPEIKKLAKRLRGQGFAQVPDNYPSVKVTMFDSATLLEKIIKLVEVKEDAT